MSAETLNSFLVESRDGCPNIVSAIKTANASKRLLDEVLTRELYQWVSLDTSLVVYGSLARNEFTQGSDLDWTYLIDGQADSNHLMIANKIRGTLESAGFKSPNQQGAFGAMVFSHPLIHQIGGEDDTNSNMTQRILLLLESVAIGGKAQEAYERVLKGIISRYLEEDSRLLTHDGSKYKVPRFLLNDIVRFWRTMAVDFASKQRVRMGKGWGLRNLKLRMSRKLLFASGLLICFGCHLDVSPTIDGPQNSDELKAYLIEYLREKFGMSPLESLAYFMQRWGVSRGVGIQLFEAYDRFLAVLNDPDARKHLDDLRAEDSATDRVFKDVRSMSRDFQDSLNGIFFKNSLISPLTEKYGVF
jgi:hypothetical protein